MSVSRRKIAIILAASVTTTTVICCSILIPLLLIKDSDDDPKDYGFDESKLNTAYLVAKSLPFIRSTLIIRYGDLIVEWYFNDGSQNAAYHIHSASKSFMSTLIGITIREGYLYSLDQKMLSFFPEYSYLDLDPRKYDITIRHLLQMKAGINFNDTGDEWIEYSTSPDWVKYALELPLIHSPGESWHYGTPQSNLLSAILTKVSGMSTREFAELHLFEPLGISISHWHQDPQGYYTGGHEMYFTPRDLARFGLLCLNNGTIDGEQIIPSEWLGESIEDYSEGKIYEVTGSSFYLTTGYGYQWWLQTLYGCYIFSARGHGGQFVFCIPDLDMVVVTTATGTVFDTYPNQYERMFNFIKYNILPSFDLD